MIFFKNKNTVILKRKRQRQKKTMLLPQFINNFILYLTVPPTRVNVTAEKVDSKLSITCSTDSSNPVSTLTWRRGVSPKPNLNPLFTSHDNTVVRDAEYNGKNITQTIDIDPKHIVKEERIFCCARHSSRDICDWMSLNPFLICKFLYIILFIKNDLFL